MDAIHILLGILGLGVGFGIAFYVRGRMVAEKIKVAETEAQSILEDAQKKAETSLKEAQIEAKDLLFKMKSRI